MNSPKDATMINKDALRRIAWLDSANMASHIHLTDDNGETTLEDGVTGCCPYGMDIFFVASEDDLYPADFVSPTVRHIPNVERINKLVTT